MRPKKKQQNFGFDKYTFQYSNSYSKAGGVGIYINNSIIHTLRSGFIFHCANYKSNWVELSVGVNIKTY